MPFPKKFYGDVLPVGTADDRQVSDLPTDKGANPKIQPDQLRNGKHPNANRLQELAIGANSAALFRTKEIFSCTGRLHLARGAVSTADRPRWRWNFRSGPLTHAVMCVVVESATDLDILGYPGYNAGSRIDIFTGADETGLVDSAEFRFGPHPIGAGGAGLIGFQHLKTIIRMIEVDPSTQYFCLLSDIDVGRAVCMTMFECPSMTENYGGYLSQNYTVQTPLVDLDRRNIAELIQSLWKHGAGKLIAWTVDDCDGGITGPVTTSSATKKNIIDTSVTTVTSASPGFALDLRNRARLSQSPSVPCKLWAFGKMSAGTGGLVEIRDSANNIIDSVAGWGTTAGWVDNDIVLPEALDTYHLFFNEPGGVNTFSLYAVGLTQYEG